MDVKTYQLKKDKEEYTVVFSAGTEYKISLSDENMSFKFVNEQRDKVLQEFTSSSTDKIKIFKTEETGIYYLQFEKQGTETQEASLSFKRELKEEE